MGWTMPFVSSRGTSFADDCGAGGGFMLSMFLRDGDEIYRTYGTTARGVDRLLFDQQHPRPQRLWPPGGLGGLPARLAAAPHVWLDG